MSPSPAIERETDFVAPGDFRRGVHQAAGIPYFGTDSTEQPSGCLKPHTLLAVLNARHDPLREMAPDPFFRLGTSSPPLLVQLSG